MRRPIWPHVMFLSVSVAMCLGFGWCPALQSQEVSRSSPSSQKETAVKGTMDQIAKDLAEVNAQLVKASQLAPQPALSSDFPNKSNMSMPLAYFGQQSTGRAEPSAGAPETGSFMTGESARVLSKKGDWYLVMNSQDRAGWVQGNSFSMLSVSDQAFENAIAAAMRMLASMKAKYEKGPVTIKGFSIDVKIPPGVSVEFEFKATAATTP